MKVQTIIKSILISAAGVMLAGGIMYALRDIDFFDNLRSGFDS